MSTHMQTHVHTHTHTSLSDVFISTGFGKAPYNHENLDDILLSCSGHEITSGIKIPNKYFFRPLCSDAVGE